MPPKKLRGTEITSAHGQEMTKNDKARSTHTAHWPVISDGTMASTTAEITTVGV